MYTWANGERYEGEFIKDVIQGQGIRYYNKGDKYEGQWKDW